MSIRGANFEKVTQNQWREAIDFQKKHFHASVLIFLLHLRRRQFKNHCSNTYIQLQLHKTVVDVMLQLFDLLHNNYIAQFQLKFGAKKLRLRR